MVFLVSLVFSAAGFCQESGSNKVLTLSFPGASVGTDITSFLSDAPNDVKPFVLRMEFSADFPKFSEIQNAEKILSQMDNVILSVNLRYPAQMQQLNSQEEIAQENYNEELSILIDCAADKVVQIIDDFHGNYPDVKIIAAASGIGSGVLLKTIEKSILKVNRITFFFPTLATVKDIKFINILKAGGYTKDTVTVFAWTGDPTIPYLEKLTTDNIETLRFGVIEKAN